MKNKKWIWMVVAAAILIGLVSGAAVFGPGRSKAPVDVYRIGDGVVGLENYFETGMENYGTVTSEHVQSVYQSDTQTILRILVQEGQPVHKGDVLFLYDTTLTDLELQRKDLAVQQMKVNLKNAQKELKIIKGYKPIYYHPTKPTETTVPKGENLDLDVSGKDYVIYSGTGKRQSPLMCWLRSGAEVNDELIGELFTWRNTFGDDIYVVFQNTEYDSGTGKVSDQFGVRFIRQELENSTEPPTEEPTEAPTETPTEQPTEVPTEVPTEPSVEVPTEAPDEESAETSPEMIESQPEEAEELEEDALISAETPESAEETSESGSGAQGNGRTSDRRYAYTMQFFIPDDPASMPPEVQKPEVDWNSGYTSSEIAAMCKEKEEQIKNLTFDIKVAETEYKIMQKEASDGMVRSEIDGTVTELNFENLPEDKLLMKITDGGGYRIEGTVSELDLNQVAVGQEVEITSWDTGASYPGVITEIGTYPVENKDFFGNSNITSYPFWVNVGGASDLRDGYAVSMVLKKNEEQESGLYLSNAFIRKDESGSYVFVRNAEGSLEKRTVKTGRILWDTYSQINEGLTADDYVAFPYGKEVLEGAPTQEGDWESLNGMQ